LLEPSFSFRIDNKRDDNDDDDDDDDDDEDKGWDEAFVMTTRAVTAFRSARWKESKKE
jgi:hypothetical protein